MAPDAPAPEPTLSDAPSAQTPDSRPVDMGPDERSVTDEAAPAHRSDTDAAALTAELAEWKDRYTRLVAEFDNFRKRTQREKETLLQVGAEGVVRALLPFFDDVELALKAAQGTDNLTTLRDGLAMMERKLKTTLDKQGIAEIAAVGEKFDSAVHEAIASLPVDDAAKKGTVIDQVEKGYRLHDRVIRYAKVITGE